MKLTIKQWRRLKDITQGNLAEACGVTTATISNWERETKDCRIPFAGSRGGHNGGPRDALSGNQPDHASQNQRNPDAGHAHACG